EAHTLPGHQRRAAKQNLASQNRRNDALSEMADAIVVVATQMECSLNPESQRNMLVGVMPTHHQDESVDEDQNVGKGRQRKTTPGQNQHGDTEKYRKDLQHPGNPVVRAQGRERKTEGSKPQEQDWGPLRARVRRHRARPTPP